MQNADGPKHDLEIVLSIVNKPSQIRWPKSVAFGVSGGAIDGPQRFSVESARKEIAELLGDGFITSDRAGSLDACVLSHGLPMEKTRYDRIMESYGAKDLMLARSLIDVFSGAVPPEPGSGAARFDLCREGIICGLPNCGRYPRHGKLYPDRITLGIDGCSFPPGARKPFSRTASHAGFLSRPIQLGSWSKSRKQSSSRVTRPTARTSSPASPVATCSR